jgi:arginase
LRLDQLGVNLEEDTVMVDVGDVDTSGDMDKSFALTEKAVAAILDKGAVPIVLGGDHSITYPVLKAFARRFKPLDVLHFDAHPDLYDDLYGDRLSHACPFARILEDGLAASVVQVGVRAVTAAHRAKALKHGVRMIEMKDIRDPLHLRFANPVYISFDMDALDPAFAPGVSHHEPGGLSTRQAVQVIQGLKGSIVGLDVVELNPARDPSAITAAAAFKIVKETAGRIVRPV